MPAGARMAASCRDPGGVAAAGLANQDPVRQHLYVASFERAGFNDGLWVKAGARQGGSSVFFLAPPARGRHAADDRPAGDNHGGVLHEAAIRVVLVDRQDGHRQASRLQGLAIGCVLDLSQWHVDVGLAWANGTPEALAGWAHQRPCHHSLSLLTHIHIITPRSVVCRSHPSPLP